MLPPLGSRISDELHWSTAGAMRSGASMEHCLQPLGFICHYEVLCGRLKQPPLGAVLVGGAGASSEACYCFSIAPVGGSEFTACLPSGLVPVGKLGAYGTPSPRHALLVAGDDGYMIDSAAPADYEDVVVSCIKEVRGYSTMGLLLVAGVHDLACYTRHGLLWLIENLSSAGISDLRCDESEVSGTVTALGTGMKAEFRAATQSGHLLGSLPVAESLLAEGLRWTGDHGPRRWG